MKNCLVILLFVAISWHIDAHTMFIDAYTMFGDPVLLVLHDQMLHSLRIQQRLVNFFLNSITTNSAILGLRVNRLLKEDKGFCKLVQQKKDRKSQKLYQQAKKDAAELRHKKYKNWDKTAGLQVIKARQKNGKSWKK